MRLPPVPEVVLVLALVLVLPPPVLVLAPPVLVLAPPVLVLAPLVLALLMLAPPVPATPEEDDPGLMLSQAEIETSTKRQR